MSDDVQAAKKRLRKEITELGKHFTDEELAAQSREIAKKITESEWYRNAKRVSIYLSMPGEMDTNAIVEKCLAEGKEVFIPYFEKGATMMDMLRLQSADEYHGLATTMWGIRQHPDKEHAERWDQHGEIL
ncbi:unnamed protein product [Gongylonema pulchrum]|uniref:5-formyltetrahydrofolate cyclo-ligase n=1 Tax=Gongylonema pulchrum TaxID=637853 RepID=A0A183EAP3_9BILA|nr:unnamed protein product [Gongylonema pulchrum]